MNRVSTIGVGILFLGVGWDGPCLIVHLAMVETRFIASSPRCGILFLWGRLGR
jgi:hypothetical protein